MGFKEGFSNLFSKTPEAGRKVIRGGLAITAAVAGGKAVVDLLQGNLSSALVSSCVAVGSGLGYVQFTPDANLIPGKTRDEVAKNLTAAGFKKKEVRAAMDKVMGHILHEAGSTVVEGKPLKEYDEWKQAAKSYVEDEDERPMLTLLKTRAPRQYEQIESADMLSDLIFKQSLPGATTTTIQTAEKVLAT